MATAMPRFATSKLALALACLTALLPSGTAAAAAEVKIRAVTFNIYNRPWERAGRLQSAAELLRREQADIIFLQEVATGWILQGDPIESFSRELGMRAQRYWHEENLGIFRTGIALLSRFPMLSSEYHEFARHDFWDAKGYMLVKLALPEGGSLNVVNLHMASTSNEQTRMSEWQELAGFVRGLRSQGPVLVGGDFNTTPENPALIEFVRQTGARNLYDGWKAVSHMRTWTPDYRGSCGQSGDPKAELIDYFFILPGAAGTHGSLQFNGGRIIVPGRPPHPSDHCPVETELRLRSS